MSRRRQRCVFHIVHWEGSDSGIAFNEKVGPRICGRCDGVVDIWDHNLDAMHASLRSLAKEGEGFRKEVADFVCLSPRMAIEYNLQKFRVYNAKMNQKVLTERIILSCPMKVQAGMVDPVEAGVGICNFPLANGCCDDRDPHANAGGINISVVTSWLSDYGVRVRRTAENHGGVAALVVVDHIGVEVNGFGVPASFIAHDPQHPITEVIVLVAGPLAYSDGFLQQFERALTVPGLGCHVGPLHLALPSARRSHAVLCELFMCHDRRMLLPILEDIREMGEFAYAEFCSKLRRAICGFGAMNGDITGKLDMVDELEYVLNAALRGAGSVIDDGDGQISYAAVQRKIDELVASGDLEQIRDWRVRQSIDASEPGTVLRLLADDFQPILGCTNLDRRWDKLAIELDNIIDTAPPNPRSTPAAVHQALQKANAMVEPLRSASLQGGLPKLLELPCQMAVEALERLMQELGTSTSPAAHLSTIVRWRQSGVIGGSTGGSGLGEADVATCVYHGPKQPSHAHAAWDGPGRIHTNGAPDRSWARPWNGDAYEGEEDSKPCAKRARRSGSRGASSPKRCRETGDQGQTITFEGANSAAAKIGERLSFEESREAPKSDACNGRVAEEVEQFLHENSVDDEAANALRQAPAEIQVKVLRRGTMASAKNKSSMLIGRLRDASKDLKKSQEKASAEHCAPMRNEVEWDSHTMPMFPPGPSPPTLSWSRLSPSRTRGMIQPQQPTAPPPKALLEARDAAKTMGQHSEAELLDVDSWLENLNRQFEQGQVRPQDGDSSANVAAECQHQVLHHHQNQQNEGQPSQQHPNQQLHQEQEPQHKDPQHMVVFPDVQRCLVQQEQHIQQQVLGQGQSDISRWLEQNERTLLLVRQQQQQQQLQQ